MDTYTLAQLVVIHQEAMYHIGSSQAFLQSTINVCDDILSGFKNLSEARNHAKYAGANKVWYTKLGHAFDAAVLYDAIEFVAMIR